MSTLWPANAGILLRCGDAERRLAERGGGSSNVSETAAFKTWKFVEPWAFCMVFLGANCRTYLSQQPSECCATTDGSVGV